MRLAVCPVIRFRLMCWTVCQELAVRCVGRRPGIRPFGPPLASEPARRVRVRSRGRLERPNDGMVADTGRFVLVDWLFTVALDDPRPSV